MNDAKQLMQKYGLRPKKFLGQNFLVDKKVLEKILAAADLSKNDTVLEVGPGPGILTEKLAERAGRVIAVEKDKKMAEILKERFRKINNIKIITADILKINIDALFCHPEPREAGRRISDFMSARTFVQDSESRLGGTQNDDALRYKVVANIPYYLTSHLIREFLESVNPPTQMVLMLQKEVAQRICAKPPQMSLLAVATQFYAIAEICAIVSKNSFWPKPKVDSAIIKMTPHYYFPLSQRGIKGDFMEIHPHPPFSKEGVNAFFRVVKAGFSQPRKQLINNLSRGLKIERPKIAAILKKIGLKPEQRAETLSLKDWVKLTKLLEI